VYLFQELSYFVGTYYFCMHCLILLYSRFTLNRNNVSFCCQRVAAESRAVAALTCYLIAYRLVFCLLTFVCIILLFEMLLLCCSVWYFHVGAYIPEVRLGKLLVGCSEGSYFLPLSLLYIRSVTLLFLLLCFLTCKQIGSIWNIGKDMILRELSRKVSGRQNPWE
jgi:hypothetical protein